MTHVYKIHPSIGVMRVGDSEEYYLGPETAGGLPILPGGGAFGPRDFRDAGGKVRRQAARFRVYRYDPARPDDPGVEVLAGQGGVRSIVWKVHLANKKAIWYEFQTLLGESGYSPDHPLRNPSDTDPATRVLRIIDAGPRTLTGPGQSARFARNDNPDGYPMTWPPEKLLPASIDALGQMHTDAEGRLVVVGGYGCSGSSKPPVITHYANNDDWWDDTSDGPVTAWVILDDGTPDGLKVEVQYPAWVITAPPGYAPQVENLVTLYDTMLDVGVRRFGTRPDIYRDEMWQRGYQPDFDTEIAPILRRGATYPWVAAIPPHAHRFDMEKLGNRDPMFDGLRQFILQILRPPSGPDLLIGPTGGGQDQVGRSISGMTMMPYLAGDNAFFFGAPTSKFLKLTDTQYFLLQQWAEGKFRRGAAAPESPGAALDRAVLTNCVGGGFSPGIEMTWISRNPAIYMEPFRLAHKKDVVPPLSLGGDLRAGMEPGDACKYMALPWQADFNECSAQPVQLQMGPESGSVTTRIAWWWPAQRPSAVWRRDEKAPDGRRQVAWVGTLEDQNAPDYVQFADDLEMVTKWRDLGFIYDFGTTAKPELLVVDRRRDDGEER